MASSIYMLNPEPPEIAYSLNILIVLLTILYFLSKANLLVFVEKHIEIANK